MKMHVHEYSELAIGKWAPVLSEQMTETEPSASTE